MTDLRQAAQQALEALLWADAQGENWQQVVKKAIKPIQEAAAQPEPVQEPFGYLWPTGSHPEFRFTQQKRDGADGMPLYTAPLQQQAEPVDGNTLLKAFLAAAKEAGVTHLQQAEPVAQRSDGMPISKTEKELRRMLCIERHGLSAYMDDGEASFCGDKYCRSIDYMRESVDSIKQAWYDAGVKKLAGAQPEQQAEPIGWLDGNDKLAEFMHRDLKAEHDKRGSATPKDFTIPVYTTLPQQQAEPVAFITPLMEQQMFDDCCPYRGNLDQRTVWAAAIEAVNGILLGTSPPQQQAEPVCEVIDGRGEVDWISFVPPAGTPLYTAPPQRKPLTDEQADQIISGLQTCHHQSSKREFLKVWLRDWAAHGIKEGT